MGEIQKYIITGGPCSGKTTLVKRLEDRGYAVVPEAARHIIEEEQRREERDKEYQGILPWNGLEEFQFLVIGRQLALERKTERRTPSGIHILDRSNIDPIAYAELEGIDISHIVQPAIQSSNYNRVFFLEQVPYEQDDQRVEDEEKGKIIHEKIYEVYEKQGLEITAIPLISDGEEGIEKRVEMILEKIRRDNKLEVLCHQTG